MLPIRENSGALCDDVSNLTYKKKEVTMKKALMMSIVTFFLFATVGSVFCEEMAKEGTMTGKLYVSGTSKALPMGEERLQMNYEGSGVIISDNGKGFLHNSAAYFIGSLHAVNGVFEETGFMVSTPPDGDKVFSTYKASGTFGKPVKGTLTYTGGTGKYEGIQGSGEFTRYALQNAKEGVWTSVNIVKWNYKLP